MTITTENWFEEWVPDPMTEVHWDELTAQEINPRPEYPTGGAVLQPCQTA
jgi:hypothetical protein